MNGPMFGISGEHILILAIVLIIFGPKRLPELGNTLGKAIKNFKDSVSGVEEAKFRHLEPKKDHDALAQATELKASNLKPADVAATVTKTPNDQV